MSLFFYSRNSSEGGPASVALQGLDVGGHRDGLGCLQDALGVAPGRSLKCERSTATHPPRCPLRRLARPATCKLLIPSRRARPRPGTAGSRGNKADVNAKANNGDTPLHFAANAGHTDVAQLLLANKAEVNAKSDKGWTPLLVAAHKGHKNMVEVLLVHKAEINAKNNKGQTPLHWAAGKGYNEMAKLLLANKAEVNAKDNNGVTPLHTAAFKSYKDVAELLRQHGGQE